MLRGRKGFIDPAVIKFGVALALSFVAAFWYSRTRTKRLNQLPPPPPTPPSDYSNLVDSGEMDCQGISSTSTDSYEPPRIRVDLENHSPLSQGSRYVADKDVFLLSEINDLINEIDKPAMDPLISPGKDEETPKSSGAGTRKTSSSSDEYEHEIGSLRNTVKLLRERERHLETQLLDFYGLKEQEETVIELQNRLKINTVEAKQLSTKIESLQAENQRLEAQVADYTKVVTELDSAKGKMKLLRKKLKNETERNKEQILSLKQRVAKLREHEFGTDADINSKLQRFKELEAECEDLRKNNFSLRLQNSELAQRLESTELVAKSSLDDPVATTELRKEAMILRQENENLAKEIERLESDRYADVEELVYLRWVNACLRYELRNYQPPPGKIVARDLSTTLSPRSEEKAKRLILEYANKQEEAGAVDLDSYRWSSSESNLTDTLEEVGSDISSSSKTHTLSKAKFLGKLRRLLLGKHEKDHDHDHDHHDHHDHHRRRPSTLSKAHSVDDFGKNQERMGDAKSRRNWRSSMTSGRSSIELGMLPRLYEEDTRDIERVRDNNAMGSPYVYKRFVLGEDHAHKNSDGSQNSELVRYAEILRNSTWTRRAHRRNASYGPG